MKEKFKKLEYGCKDCKTCLALLFDFYQNNVYN